MIKLTMKAFGFMSIALFYVGALAFAADAPMMNDDVQKAIINMTKEMDQLKKLVQDQNVKIQYLEQKTKDNVSVAQPVQQTTATPTPMGEKDFQAMLKNEISNYPYLKNLKMGGDFRLRYEAFDEQKSTGSLENRNRFRYRLRYGIENKIDDFTVGFRLATGVLNSRDEASGSSARTVYSSDPTSTNQTLGNPGLFSFNTLVIEKAYAKYNPAYFKYRALGPVTVKNVEIGGGKFENPFISSPMVWDGDVTPEGLYEKVNINLYAKGSNELSWFGTAMQSPLKENAAGEQDANLWAFQTGLTATTNAPINNQPIDFTTAFALYKYDNYAADSNYILDSVSSLARGNTTCVGTAGAGDCIGLEAGNPTILDFYNEIRLRSVLNTPISVFHDVAVNINNGAMSSGAAEKDAAYGLGFKIGSAKKKGQWEASYGYYLMPPNAVVGAFSDSDFGQGHTNEKGSVIKAGYMLSDSLSVNLAWFHVHPYAVGLSFPTTDIDSRTDRFQTDLAWKF